MERLSSSEHNPSGLSKLLRCSNNLRLARLSDVVVEVEYGRDIGAKAGHERIA